MKQKGVLIFESQALDALVPKKFEPKMEFLETHFNVLEKRRVKSEYPLNVPERIFLVLEKNTIY